MSYINKSREAGPGQEALFSLSEINNPNHQTQVLEQELPPAKVNIDTRAYHLGETLNELGKYRKLVGFQQATNSDSHFRKKIEERYKSNLGDVIDGAADKIDTSYLRAKNHFARASGHFALINSGLMSEEDAKKSTSQEFHRLEASFFGDNKKTNERSRFKRKLDRQRKAS